MCNQLGRLLLSLGPFFAFVAHLSAATFTVDGPTTDWKIIPFGSIYPDPPNDQQTGSAEGDIVGNKEHPCFYSAFDDETGSLGFRIRISDQKNPPGYGECAFVGFDIGRKGKVDFFVGLDNTGARERLGIWPSGTGENVSPSTTTIGQTPLFSYSETLLNYSWMPVSLQSDPTATIFDLDAGGDVDRFLCFVLPFADIAAAAQSFGLGSISPQTTVGYAVATATQPNSFNQDIIGITGGVNSSTAWLQLGAISDEVRINTSAIPEPMGWQLMVIALLFCRSRKA